ncbi:protein OXIDATIVE STRESS 3-like [Cornus florida]|uniref:protein OXIDATIVE STRESS 3-like n=1 Tax=Cornus florida TaxID=4283 RepID=UPI00289F1C69|nr:protein OXIDATIVE STRESS 3-like [Cornus florida]
MLQGRPCSPYGGDDQKDDDHQWDIMEGNDHEDDDDRYNITSSTSSLEDSMVSNGSASSSTDMADDASSSTSYSSSLQSSTGSLYDLSELMAQLPIKRGLSKFYQGKSQSFTLLSRVGSIEDVAKKESPAAYRRKMKACKSHGGGLDSYKSLTLPKPKPVISKKVSSRPSLLSSSFPTRRSPSFIATSCRPPLSPRQKKL